MKTTNQMSKSPHKKALHWYGIRKFSSLRRYDNVMPELLSISLATTQRADMKEYYCKLCGYGYGYASLHAIRMHALETHENDGSFRLG